VVAGITSSLTGRPSKECPYIVPKGESTVKSLLGFLVVLAIGIVALGFWRGWFDVGGQKADGKVQANLDINVAKFKADKEALKKLLGEKSSTLKAKLATLKNKAKDLTGEAKAKAEKEIEALTKKHEAMEKKITEVDGSTEEKLLDLKNSVKDEAEAPTARGKVD
jgi:ABC-type proline/glycine betaine transport system substrate-binding protein